MKLTKSSSGVQITSHSNAERARPLRLTRPAEAKSVPNPDFQKPMGVTRVEVQNGFVQVHISRISTGMVVTERLRILAALAVEYVGLSFLKMTPSGISFVIPRPNATRLEPILAACGDHYKLRHERSLIVIHASNIRETPGLTAKIITAAFHSGANIDLIGDMHDRVSMVVETKSAAKVSTYLRHALLPAYSASFGG